MCGYAESEFEAVDSYEDVVILPEARGPLTVEDFEAFAAEYEFNAVNAIRLLNEVLVHGVTDEARGEIVERNEAWLAMNDFIEALSSVVNTELVNA